MSKLLSYPEIISHFNKFNKSYTKLNEKAVKWTIREKRERKGYNKGNSRDRKWNNQKRPHNKP